MKLNKCLTAEAEGFDECSEKCEIGKKGIICYSDIASP